MNLLEEILIGVAVVVIFGGGMWVGGIHARSTLKSYQETVAAEKVEAANLATAAEVARNLKEKTANENNSKVIDGLHAQLSAGDVASVSLAARLRLAENRTSAARCPVPAGNDRPGVTVATDLASGPSGLDLRIAAYDAACQHDAASLAALIAEIKPQL